MRPKIVQHSAGKPNAGGPSTALARIVSSDLASKYEFTPMPQLRPAGGINLRLIWEFTRILKTTRPDLVHVRGLGNEGFHAVLAAKLARTPRILLTVHGTVRDLSQHSQTIRTRIIWKVLEPLTLLLATDVGTVCEFAANRKFLSGIHRSGKFIGVIPNGIENPDLSKYSREAERSRLNLLPDEVVFSLVSRLTIEKGFFVLADALSHIVDPAVPLHFLIVGSGPNEQEIRARLTARSGVKVTFLGQTSDVFPVLAASDVFLFPSLHENLSNALLEAMSMGLPIIASNVGGNAEVLSKGGGLLVPVSDPERLAEAILEFAADPDLRHELGVQARKVVSENYSQARMTEALDNVYTKMLIETRP